MKEVKEEQKILHLLIQATNKIASNFLKFDKFLTVNQRAKNAYTQNAAATANYQYNTANAAATLDPNSAAYYQQYYAQYYGQNAAQYMQNYGQAYNYNQTAAAYGTQGYNAQQNYANYANYGYNTQNYTQQNYNQQLQQLQQQLQPTTIQQSTPPPQSQTTQPAQTILPGLAGTSMSSATTDKKAEPLIATEQQSPVPAGKTMELEQTPSEQVSEEKVESNKMFIEEKSKDLFRGIIE